MKRCLRRIIVVLAPGLFLALPGLASAAQTIGQTGDVSPNNCAADEAYVQLTTAAGPVYSPSAYGVITSWSARSKAGANQTVKLLVLRDDGSNRFSVVARDSIVRTLSSVDDFLNTFPGTRIPIEASQRIGVYLPAGSLEGCEFSTGNAGDNAGFGSPFGVGEPPDNVPFDYSGADNGNRVNASAVVEPDTDRDAFGDETQDRCLGSPGPFNGCPNAVTLGKIKAKGTKVKVTATVPGPGTLSAGSANDPALAAQAGKSKPLLKAVTQTLASASTQRVPLSLKLTKAAKSKLADTGKLKLKVKAVFTPTGGPSGSQTKKTKLKS
jgi:hypothetical protein